MGFFSSLLNFIDPYKHEGISAEEKNSAKQQVLDRYNSNGGVDPLTDITNNILQAYQTSAKKLEEEATADSRSWTEGREDLAWQRSQSSARELMKFQKEQSDLAWQRSQSSAREQMAFQERMWNKTVDYNTEMANSQYQRLVSDLRKSGINPILAVNKGGSSVPNASVPSGSSSSAQAMSGASTSYSSSATSKADYSKALTVDKKVDALGISLSAITSALKLLNF